MAIEFEFQLSINYKNLIAIGFIIFAIAALVFSFGVAFSSNNEKEEPYEFVYCYNEVTNSTITYPTGTQCYNEEEEETEDEKEHEYEKMIEEDENEHDKESREYYGQD